MFEKTKAKRALKKINKSDVQRFKESNADEQLQIILKKNKETCSWKVDLNMDDDDDAIARRERIDALKNRLGK